jgi:hypothetical protein
MMNARQKNPFNVNYSEPEHMKLSKLIASFLIMLLGLTVVSQAFAQMGDTRLYIAQDRSFTFVYPETWEVAYDDEFDAAVASSRSVDVYVFAPVTAEELEIKKATPTAIAHSIAERYSDTFRLGTIQELDIADRPAARLDFMYANTPGFYLIIDLGDSTFGVVEPFGLQGDTQVMDEDIIFDIAASYKVGVGHTNPMLGQAISEYGNQIGTAG